MEKMVAYAGNDVHQEFTSISVYMEGGVEPVMEKRVRTEKAAIQKFYKRLGQRYRVKACYEAGSNGYVFYWWMREIGTECAVIAPSLIPRSSSDRVKTDERDARKLGRLYRSGDLVSITVPSQEAAAKRSLIRLRSQIKREENQSKQYLLKFLQQRGLGYGEGRNWTLKHWKYIREVEFRDEEEGYVYRRYIELLEYKQQELRSVNERIAELAKEKTYAAAVQRLRCLRGIDVLSAMTLVTEIVDFSRFRQPRELMAYVGLVPGQYSSAGKRRDGSITRSGNSRVRRVLVEAAWHYRHAPRVSKALAKRQEGQDMAVIHYAWKAQRRLHKRFGNLSRRKNLNVAVVAVARELVGFIWSLMVNRENYGGTVVA